jgi:hypothetical protein
MPISPAGSAFAGGEGAVQVVTNFYRALAAGDGEAAAAIIVPSKRGRGPFNGAEMSRFYGRLKKSLSIRSIRQIDGNVVEAQYSYKVSSTECRGTAIVETEQVMSQMLIRRIRANC